MDALGHNSVVEHQGLVILGSTNGEIWMKRLNIEQRIWVEDCITGKNISHRLKLNGIINIKYINLTHGYEKRYTSSSPLIYHRPAIQHLAVVQIREVLVIVYEK